MKICFYLSPFLLRNSTDKPGFKYQSSQINVHFLEPGVVPVHSAPQHSFHLLARNNPNPMLHASMIYHEKLVIYRQTQEEAKAAGYLPLTALHHRHKFTLRLTSHVADIASLRNQHILQLIDLKPHHVLIKLPVQLV